MYIIDFIMALDWLGRKIEVNENLECNDETDD
jgi:hypothetical protein